MIGISSPHFSLFPFDQVFEALAKDFKLWEIVAEVEHSMQEVEDKMRHAMNSYDMQFQVHAPIADINLGCLEERMRIASMNEFLRIVDACERLEIGLITVHPGSVIAYGSNLKPRVVEATLKSLREIDDRVSDSSVRVALENMPPAEWSICHNLPDLLKLIEGTEIGVCFDAGHANIAGPEAVESFLTTGYDLLNVHLHNNDGTADQHLVVNKGSLDYAPIFRFLRDSYHGNYIIESRNIEEGVEARQFLETFIE